MATTKTRSDAHIEDVIAGVDAGLYDVRGLGTHEAGHVFGMDDLYGDDAELTMYGYGTICSAKQRTLGVGDVLGLRSVY